MSEEKIPPQRLRWEATSAPATGIWALRRRLAAAMRRVIEHLVTIEAPRGALQAAADRLEEYADYLAEQPRRQRYVGFSEAAVADERTEDEEGREGGHFDFSPLIGRSNPLSPPIEMSSDPDGTVYGRVTFGSAYEGPPASVHGGYVAAAFDEVLGYAETFSDHPGMTGTLNVVYRRPTPLHVPLLFTAKIDRVEGRKIFVAGTLHAGEELCAEATGIFVGMRPGTFEKLIAERAAREAAAREGGDG